MRVFPKRTPLVLLSVLGGGWIIFLLNGFFPLPLKTVFALVGTDVFIVGMLACAGAVVWAFSSLASEQGRTTAGIWALATILLALVVWTGVIVWAVTVKKSLDARDKNNSPRGQTEERVGIFSKHPVLFSEAEQDVVAAALEQTRRTSTHTNGVFVIEKIASLRGVSWSDKPQKTARLLREQAKRRDATFRNAIEDLLTKNAQDTEFDLPKKRFPRVILMSTTELKDIFERKPEKIPVGWNLFYKMHPTASGIVNISRPGISRDGSVAIIYLGQQSHYLAGAGQLWVFKKQDGKWVLQHDSIGPKWVS